MKVSSLDTFSENNRKKDEDMIYKYQSVWPIYSLSTKNKKGLWETFENKILDLVECNKLQDVSEKEFQCFLDENPNIELELCIFEKTLPELFFIKVDNTIYCYTTSKLNKKLKKFIDVRFYFDIEKFLKIEFDLKEIL